MGPKLSTMLFVAVFLLAADAFAGTAGLTSPTPHCGIIKNDSDRSMTGSIRTDYYTKDDGSKGHHEATFRLKPGEDQQFCSTGPFYPGYKVGLILRTLAPVFDCKTRLAGTILLKSEKRADGTIKIYAICVP
jgi:hypothetical protein